MQLKILQTLPALLHNYSDNLSGELLAHVLEVCATLQASKVAAVSNTAAATLQQLISSAFEKVLVEDGKMQPLPKLLQRIEDLLTYHSIHRLAKCTYCSDASRRFDGGHRGGCARCSSGMLRRYAN